MNIKKRLLLCLFLTLFNVTVSAQFKDKIKTIVIDAGHGGHDPGCLGKKSQEKTVALAVALQAGKLISEQNSDVKVIFTRKTDVFVELFRRAQIANNNHADVFISIHCNASESKTAHGTETYVMGLHRTEANLAVAKKENAAILLEKNYENNYEGFDPASPESNIIFSLYTTAYLKSSASLAAKVQSNLVSRTKLFNRKVQQAGYWVLYKVAMPSILIELGFLSNPEEEEFLIKAENQNVMAQAIADAFTDYKNEIERKAGRDKENTHASKPEADTAATGNSSNGHVKDIIEYRIQFYASERELNPDNLLFKGLDNVKKYRENNLWKYTAGNSVHYDEIVKMMPEIRKKYPDAFIIAFQNDKKISITRARELQRRK
ncbi:MAG: N-acetylmuramoyl-L-alanine amidase [Bacteroidales bacterium]|jgi:N-acetylmuramoyl-L-alanine amidase|nr:N-acetylmuramoyl-L-alanine amidase [Bacteroidales bacterium]